MNITNITNCENDGCSTPKNSDVSRAHRVDVAHCDACDQDLCLDCLRAMALEQGLTPNVDAGQEECAESFLYKCEATDQHMCAACFEAEKEE